MKKTSQQNRQIWYMLLWFGGITILTVIDQLTKHLAVKYLKGTSGIILIPNVLEFQYVENRGMAFGLLQGRQILFLILCVAFCAGILCLYARIPKNSYYAPLSVIGGILFSGALGNFIDRAFYGYVTDFIYFSLIDFPVFNIADIGITVGAILLVVYFIWFDKEDKNADVKSKIAIISEEYQSMKLRRKRRYETL